MKNKTQQVTNYILQGGVRCYAICGFPFRSSVLPDRNAPRNPSRQHVPTDMTSMGFADKLDPTCGTLVGTANIKNEGKAETAWREISAKVNNITGVHGLYFKFISEDKDGIICDLKSFQFSKVL
jgi:hypothetical protein